MTKLYLWNLHLYIDMNRMVHILSACPHILKIYLHNVKLKQNDK